MGNGLRHVGPLLVGILVGWLAARTLPDNASPAPAPAVEVAEVTTKECPPVPPASMAPPESVPPVTPEPSIRERLFTLKISDVRDLCDDAERNFQKNSIDNYALALNDLPKSAREQEMAALTRQFLTVADKDLFWRSEFSLESAGEVLTMEVLLDLESNSEAGSQCAAWTVFYELNGRANPDSLMGASACDGNGFRKKNGDFYVDLTLYSIPSLGRHVTSLLMPFPGGGGRPEYLDAEGKVWKPLPAASWVRASRAEFLARHKKFQEKLEGISDGR